MPSGGARFRHRPEAVLPPTHEEIEPFALVREAQLDLDLLAARDSSVKSPALVDHPVHQAVILVGDRPREFATDDVVRQVTGQAQFGKTVEQAKREVEIGGHAVAVRLEVQRHAFVLRQPPPAFDQRHALGHGVRPHVRLQVHVIGAELPYVVEYRTQVVDGARIALRLPAHAPFPQLRYDGTHVVAVEESNPCAVEPGGADHVELLRQRPLEAVGTPLLHRPQRLVDEQLSACASSRACRTGEARTARSRPSTSPPGA